MSTYDNKDLPVAYSNDGDDYNEVNEEAFDQRDDNEEIKEESEEVYELPDQYSDRNRIWSILSVLLGGLSIILSPFVFYVSLLMSASAFLLAGLSRKKFGFFTRMTLVGMMVSMIGAVFGLSFMTVEIFGLF